MKPKLSNLRLLASLCNLNYLQISVKEKWLNSKKKKKKERKIWSIYREVLSVTWPNFTVVKCNSKISIIYYQIKISKRYTKAVLKIFAIFTEKHLCWSFFLNKNAVFSPETLSKRGFDTGFFKWILRNF